MDYKASLWSLPSSLCPFIWQLSEELHKAQFPFNGKASWEGQEIFHPHSNLYRAKYMLEQVQFRLQAVSLKFLH